MKATKVWEEPSLPLLSFLFVVVVANNLIDLLAFQISDFQFIITGSLKRKLMTRKKDKLLHHQMRKKNEAGD